ncbi:MAG: hypothetical protein AAGE85_04815 [Pseudomonadota bacterium]
MHKVTLLLSAIVTGGAALIAEAQTGTPPPACSEAAGFGDFDFWVGEWKVYSNDDQRQFAGDNSISKHHGDCLIKENWRGAGGSAGFSINYYNSVTDEWRQVWVANGYSIDYTGGLDESGAMLLEGSLYNYAQESKTPFRGIWTPQADGSVVQRFEIHDAETDGWTLWFEGLYIRADE